MKSIIAFLLFMSAPPSVANAVNLPAPPTCTGPTVALHWSSGHWSCDTITGTPGPAGPAGPGIAIGSPVPGGTANQCLTTDANNNLAQTDCLLAK